MNIISLQDLCQRELSSLLDARYMRTGWNKEGDRKARAKEATVGTLLEKLKPTMPNPLIVYPSQSVIKPLLYQAASERTIEGMVSKMVELFAELPVMDQAEACAVAEVKEQVCSIATLHMEIERALAQLKSREKIASVAGIQLSPLLDEMESTLASLQNKRNDLEKVLRGISPNLQ